MSKEAKPDTWMPLVIGDYKKDTGRLTRDLHGGYLLLIMEYWTTGPLADDDAELAAIVLATPREWKTIRPKLVRFFRVEDGVWRHKRIDRELEGWAARKAKFAERASKAGQANAAKRGSTRTSSRAPQEVLGGFPPSISTEVDVPSGQSTLCGRDAPEARHEGASGLRVLEGGKGEREAWADALRQAEIDLDHFSASDADFASEIAEFIATAATKIDQLSEAAA